MGPQELVWNVRHTICWYKLVFYSQHTHNVYSLPTFTKHTSSVYGLSSLLTSCLQTPWCCFASACNEVWLTTVFTPVQMEQRSFHWLVQEIGFHRAKNFPSPISTILGLLMNSHREGTSSVKICYTPLLIPLFSQLSHPVSQITFF